MGTPRYRFSSFEAEPPASRSERSERVGWGRLRSHDLEPVNRIEVTCVGRNDRLVIDQACGGDDCVDSTQVWLRITCYMLPLKGARSTCDVPVKMRDRLVRQQRLVLPRVLVGFDTGPDTDVELLNDCRRDASRDVVGLED